MINWLMEYLWLLQYTNKSFEIIPIIQTLNKNFIHFNNLTFFYRPTRSANELFGCKSNNGFIGSTMFAWLQWRATSNFFVGGYGYTDKAAISKCNRHHSWIHGILQTCYYKLLRLKVLWNRKTKFGLNRNICQHNNNSVSIL